MNKNEKLNVRNYGSLLGATVYRIVPEIVDLDYKKKVEDNKLRLTKPIYRFVPKKINITKTSLELGADGVFVGSGIFKSENPEKFARAIVQATTHYQDYDLIARLSEDLGEAMKGLEISKLAATERMQDRGW